MSNTSASLPVAATAAGGLPTPKPELFGGTQAYAKVDVPQGSPTSPTLVARWVRNPIRVTVNGVPQSLIDSGTVLLELGRVRARRERFGNLPATSGKSGNVVHPSNAPAPSGVGSHTHGGNHSGVSPAVQSLRVTEWVVTDNGFSVDVTQACMAWFIASSTYYRDPTATLQPVNVTVPVAKQGHWYPGSRFAYGSRLHPGRFAFRVSAVDTTDPRGQRIWGAWSELVTIAHTVHPIKPDPVATATNGVPCAVIHPMHAGQPDQMSAWLGSNRGTGTL